MEILTDEQVAALDPVAKRRYQKALCQEKHKDKYNARKRAKQHAKTIAKLTMNNINSIDDDYELRKHITFDGTPIGENRKKKPGDIGYDCRVEFDTIVMPGLPRTAVSLGHKISLPNGTEEQIRPRSGFSLRGIEGVNLKLVDRKQWIKRENGHYVIQLEYEAGQEVMNFDADVIVGTVDPGYPDKVCAIVNSREPRPILIKERTRLAQAVFNDVELPVLVMGNVNSDGHREGGFGTSGSGTED